MSSGGSRARGAPGGSQRGNGGSGRSRGGRRTAKRHILDFLTNSTASEPQCVIVKFALKYDASPGETVHVVGGPKQLGAWDTNHAVAMNDTHTGNWHLSVALPKGQEFNYQYVVKSDESGSTPGVTTRSSARQKMKMETGIRRSVTLTKKGMQSMGVAVVVADAWQYPKVGSTAKSGQTLKQAVSQVLTTTGTIQEANVWQERCIQLQGEMKSMIAARDMFVNAKVAQNTADLQETNAALRSKAESLTQAARISRREADEAREALATCKATMEAQCHTLKAQLNDATAQLEELRANHKSAKASVQKLAAELKLSAKAAVAAKSSSNQAHADTMAKLQAKLKEAQRSATRAHADLKLKHTQDMTNATSEHATALSAVQQERDALQASLDRAQEQLSNNTTTIAGLDGKCTTLSASLAAAQQELEASRESTRADLDAARVERDAAVAAAVADAEAARAELETVTQELVAARSECSQLTSRVAAMATEEAALRTELQSASDTAAAHASRASSLEATLATEREASEATQAQLTEELRVAHDNLTEQLQMARAEAQVVTTSLREKAQRAVTRYGEAATDCRHWFNTAMTLKGNIRVFCRVRPQSATESDAGHAAAVAVAGTRTAVVTAGGRDTKKYAFDRVFNDGESQERVFKEVAPLVTSALDGYNVCVFAYGQTGSGKTHTMMGNGSDPGVIPRTVSRLFALADDRRDLWAYTFSVAVLEIYNESIRDLLARAPASSGSGSGSGSGGGSGAVLDVRVNRGKVEIPGLTERQVRSAQDVDRVIAAAHKNRSVSATKMNAHSSRSHMVLRLACTATHRMSGDVATSKMHLVDLAGSERLSRSKVTGEQLRETKHINSSLSALGDVIHALQSKNKHIPYRNSKLTYLLQDALGGSSKTLMMCQVSPCASSASETICTLNFAKRAASVQLATSSATANVQSGADDKRKRALAAATAKVAQLEAALEAAQAAVGTAKTAASKRAAKQLATAQQEAAKAAAEAEEASAKFRRAAEAAREAKRHNQQLQQDLAAATADDSKAARRVQTLQEQLATAEAATSKLQGQVTATEAAAAAQVEELRTQLAAKEAAITALQQQVHAAAQQRPSAHANSGVHNDDHHDNGDDDVDADGDELDGRGNPHDVGVDAAPATGALTKAGVDSAPATAPVIVADTRTCNKENGVSKRRGVAARKRANPKGANPKGANPKGANPKGATKVERPLDAAARRRQSLLASRARRASLTRGTIRRGPAGSPAALRATTATPTASSKKPRRIESLAAAATAAAAASPASPHRRTRKAGGTPAAKPRARRVLHSSTAANPKAGGAASSASSAAGGAASSSSAASSRRARAAAQLQRQREARQHKVSASTALNLNLNLKRRPSLGGAARRVSTGRVSLGGSNVDASVAVGAIVSAKPKWV